MAEIKRRTIDTHFENQITTAMIMSTKFLTDIRPLYNPDYMKNTFARIICYWCVDHFDHYKKAPGKNIESIFLVESESGLPKEDAEIIKDFLTKLNSLYSESQGINNDLIKQYAFDYFRKRDLEIRSAKAQTFLELGKIDEAEDQFLNFKQVAFQTSGWINPFDVQQIFSTFDDETDPVLKLPGALGHLVGPIERGWFIGVLGPFKRGKSFFLQEIAIRGLMQGLKVVFISLEMMDKDVKKRFYKRLTGFGSRTGEDVFLFPTFDCAANQDGTCAMRQRTQLIKLLGTDGSKPNFDIDMDYRPCVYCRENHMREYRLATWFETLEVPQFSFSNTRDHMRAEEIMHGDNFRFMCYPKFTASVSDMKRDLFILEQYEGFIPDLIVTDHADIFKLGKSNNKVGQIDDVWKELGSLAAERHSIVVTASQGTRGAIYKESVAQDDLAEWIGKLGHVDIFMGLSQTPDEKESKIIRANLLAHRHKDVDETVFAEILQQLDVGQFYLDSEIKYRRRSAT